jgi:predicted alpha/beta-fold hydrolase
MNPTTMRSVDLDTVLLIVKRLREGAPERTLFDELLFFEVTLRELWSEDARFMHAATRANSAYELLLKGLDGLVHVELLERWMEDFEKRGFDVVSTTLEIYGRHPLAK